MVGGPRRTSLLDAEPVSQQPVLAVYDEAQAMKNPAMGNRPQLPEVSMLNMTLTKTGNEEHFQHRQQRLGDVLAAVSLLSKASQPRNK